jgi:hypothetical protein
MSTDCSTGPEPAEGCSTAALAGLLSEHELQSLAWAVRRASRNADGYGDKTKAAQRAFQKLRHAAAAASPNPHLPSPGGGEPRNAARAH